MRKSVLLPALAVAGGIVGLLVRRVYLANGFEVGTGLPIAGAPSLWAMALVAVAVVVVLAVLSAGKQGIQVACGRGESLYLTEIQAEGGKRMAAASYLLGHPLEV